MKRILTLLLLLTSSLLYSQATLTDLNLVFDILASNNVTSSTFEVEGAVFHSTTEYSGLDVQVGDLVYFQDGPTTYSLPIQSITTQNYSYIKVVLVDESSTVSYVPTGRAAVVSVSDPNLLPVPPDGIPQDLATGILNDLRLKIQIGVNNAEEITDYIGSVDTPPAYSASLHTGETWRNSVGQLFYSNGTQWLTDKEVLLTNTSLLNQPSSIYKLGIDTSGVNDVIYVSNNNIFKKLEVGGTLTGEVITVADTTQLDTVHRVQFYQYPLQSGGERILRWNDTDGTLDLGLKGGNVTLQLGQEQVSLVKHADNSGLDNGKVVYLVGSDGQNKTVRYAQANSEATSAVTFGLMTESSTGGNKAFATTFGLVRNINTSNLTEGKVVWLSADTAGAMTAVRPIAPNHGVMIGFCVRKHATQGVIFVEIQNGYELDELHNVHVPSPSDNQALVWIAANSRWEARTIDTNPSDDITGSGVLNYLPQFNSTSSIDTTGIIWVGGRMGIGTATPSRQLTVAGDAEINGLRVGKGNSSLNNIVLGANNVMASITTGASNIGIGSNSLRFSTTAIGNVGIGQDALLNNINGSNNIAIGNLSMVNNKSGSGNTVIGPSALNVHDLNDNVVAIGREALINGRNSDNTVAVGSYAAEFVVGGGINTRSRNSIFLGYNTKPLDSLQVNQTVIGYEAEGLGNNTTVIGNSSTTQTWLGGSLSLGTQIAPLARLHVSAAGTTGAIGAVLVTDNATTPVNLFEVRANGDIYLNKYPNTLNSTGNPVNVLSTSSTGVVESHPISEVISSAGGITGSGAAGQVTFWNGTSTVSGNNGLWWDNSNARLGIGTTTPSEKLDVTGNILLRSGYFQISGNTTNSYPTASNSSLIFQTGQSGTAYPYQSVGNLVISSRTDAQRDIVFMTSTGNIRTVIKGDSGNVGIGTTTPAEKLDIVGNIQSTGWINPIGGVLNELKVSGTTIPKYTINNTTGSVVDAMEVGQLNFFINDGNTGGNTPTGNIAMIISDNSVGSIYQGTAGEGADMVFRTGLVAVTGQQQTINERLRITKNGLVSIGAVTPTRTLDINGETRIRDLTTTTATGLVGADADGVLSNVTFASAVSQGGGLTGNGVTNYLAQYNSSNTLDTTGIIWTGGRMGIGTATPSATFDVVGTVDFQNPTTAFDAAIVGAELLTTGTGTNWVGTSYATGYRHTVGSTVALTSAFTPIAANYYVVTVTVDSVTAGSISFTFGTNSGTTISSNTTQTNYWVAGSTGKLIITPTTDFNGIVVASVKLITESPSQFVGRSSNGNIVYEERLSFVNSNIFQGFNTGQFNTTGNQNVFQGFQVGQYNTIGSLNIFQGYQAGRFNTIGSQNIFQGWRAGYSNISGNQNIFQGFSAGQNNLTGVRNIFQGFGAGGGNTTGSNNVFQGASSGSANTIGEYNIAIGTNSLYSNIDGNNNIAFGFQAGRYIASASTGNTKLDNSIIIGNDARANNINQSNQIVIGYLGRGLGSNTTRIGNTSTIQTHLDGRLTIGNTFYDSRVAARIVGADASTSNYSLVVTDSDGATSTTVDPNFVVRNDGLVGIGTYSPTAKLQINGSGNTSATNALRVENSDGTQLLNLQNQFVSGAGVGLQIGDGTSANTTFIDIVRGAATVRTRYIDVRTSSDILYISGGSGVGNNNLASNFGSVTLGDASYSLTNPTQFNVAVSVTGTFAPTSGGARFVDLLIKPTINQTGGSNGISRGLYVIPTLTSVADWRSIEWSNNTGYGLYGAGTANNYLGGSLGIGATTPSRTLHVAGEARISDLTTDTPTRIVGADADGDLGEITLGSGLSITSGVLNTSSTLNTGSGTAGQVTFWNGTNSITGSSNFIWDNTNSRLGIKRAAPSFDLDVNGGGRFLGGSADAGVRIDGGTNSFFRMNAGVSVALFSHNYQPFSPVSQDNTAIPSWLWRFGGGTGADFFDISRSPAGSTTMTSFFRLDGSGNLGVNISVPTARLHVQGSGNTSSTTALNVQNSDGNALFRVFDNGVVNFGTQLNRGFWVNNDGSNTPVLDGTSLRFSHSVSSQNQSGFYFRGANTLTATSGAQFNATFDQGFAPTSGTATFNQIVINNTINQTGGANGITRGLLLSPTLTSAFDWRSIQWNNNTGFGLYGEGTAPNRLNGILSLPLGNYNSAALQINSDAGTGLYSAGAANVNLKTSGGSRISLENASANYFRYSEDITNAVWNKIRVSITPNAIMAPDSTLTADLVVNNGTVGLTRINQNPTMPSGTDFTYSIFVKQNNNSSNISFGLFNSGQTIGWTVSVNPSTFNIIGSSGSGGVTLINPATVDNYGNGWYKITISLRFPSAITSISCVLDISQVSGEGVYVWGAQAEAGGVGSSYIETVASAVGRPQAVSVLGSNIYGTLLTRTLGAPSFQDLSFTTQNATRMTITNGGNVGIGNSAPQKTLHVTGEVRISDLDNGVATRIVGATTDGDLDELTLGSGLSITSGTISVTNPISASEVFIESSTATTIDLDANTGVVKDVNGTNASFTLPTDLSRLNVYKNGIRLARTGTATTRDFSVNTGTNEITFTTALLSTDRIVIVKI